jgi:hypothetical protein
MMRFPTLATIYSDKHPCTGHMCRVGVHMQYPNEP